MCIATNTNDYYLYEADDCGGTVILALYETY